MKIRFIQVAMSVYIGAALLIFLTACNNESSNPLTKYNVKGGPVTNEKSENQTKVGSENSYFSVDIGDLKDGRSASFVEGLEGQVLVKITTKSSLIKNYKLSLLDFPHQQIPHLQSTSTPGIFALMWKVPSGIVPPGALGAELQASLLLTISESNDQRLLNVAEAVKIHIFITKNITQPEIINFTSLEKGIDEGSQVPFIIDVNDPAGANSSFPPNIIISSYIHSNTEAFTADGRHMVQPDSSRTPSVQNLGNGKWRFYYVINAERFVDNRDRKGNIDPNANSVSVCFLLNAESINKSRTFNRNICFTGRFAAQTPTLSWNDQNPNEIKSGVESIFKFTISSANNLGKTEIKEQAKFLASLSGTKNLKCEASANNEVQNCELSWTPTCSRVNSNKKLMLKVENKLNDKVKSLTFEKDIALQANPDLCPAKKVQTQQAQTKGATK